MKGLEVRRNIFGENTIDLKFYSNRAILFGFDSTFSTALSSKYANRNPGLPKWVNLLR